MTSGVDVPRREVSVAAHLYWPLSVDTIGLKDSVLRSTEEPSTVMICVLVELVIFSVPLVHVTATLTSCLLKAQFNRI